jgi:ribosomal protein S18 acetylase RimI-like enzyme
MNLRRYRGASDDAALQAIRLATEAAGKRDWIPNSTDFAAWDRAQNDCLIAEVDGVPIGFTWLFWYDERNDPRAIYCNMGWVHPAYRRRGIGRAMLTEEEQLCRNLARDGIGPSRLATSKWFLATQAEDDNPVASQMFLNAGYRLHTTRLTLARANLNAIPEASMPEDFEIRPARPEHYPLVWKSIDEDLSDADPEYVNSPRCDPTFWQLAWLGDQLAGLVINHIDGDCGKTPWVWVAPAFRRIGLARALMYRSLRRMLDRGARRAEILTMQENQFGSWALYQSLGYEIVKRNMRYLKAMDE